MNREEKIQFIIDYYNEHFKWQKLIYGQEIDRTKVEKMADTELDDFIKKYCKKD